MINSDLCTIDDISGFSIPKSPHMQNFINLCLVEVVEIVKECYTNRSVIM